MVTPGRKWFYNQLELYKNFHEYKALNKIKEKAK